MELLPNEVWRIVGDNLCPGQRLNLTIALDEQSLYLPALELIKNTHLDCAKNSCSGRCPWVDEDAAHFAVSSGSMSVVYWMENNVPGFYDDSSLFAYSKGEEVRRHLLANCSWPRIGHAAFLAGDYETFSQSFCLPSLPLYYYVDVLGRVQRDGMTLTDGHKQCLALVLSGCSITDKEAYDLLQLSTNHESLPPTITRWLIEIGVAIPVGLVGVNWTFFCRYIYSLDYGFVLFLLDNGLSAIEGFQYAIPLIPKIIAKVHQLGFNYDELVDHDGAVLCINDAPDPLAGINYLLELGYQYDANRLFEKFILAGPDEETMQDFCQQFNPKWTSHNFFMDNLSLCKTVMAKIAIEANGFTMPTRLVSQQLGRMDGEFLQWSESIGCDWQHLLAHAPLSILHDFLYCCERLDPIVAVPYFCWIRAEYRVLYADFEMRLFLKYLDAEEGARAMKVVHRATGYLPTSQDQDVHFHLDGWSQLPFDPTFRRHVVSSLFALVELGMSPTETVLNFIGRYGEWHQFTYALAKRGTTTWETVKQILETGRAPIFDVASIVIQYDIEVPNEYLNELLANGSLRFIRCLHTLGRDMGEYMARANELHAIRYTIPNKRYTFI